MKKKTEEKIKKNGMVLTELLMYNDPDILIETQYGNLPYIRWLEKEKERIDADPTRVTEIIFAKDGEVALFANEIKEGG